MYLLGKCVLLTAPSTLVSPLQGDTNQCTNPRGKKNRWQPNKNSGKCVAYGDICLFFGLAQLQCDLPYRVKLGFGGFSASMVESLF
jgi:hypothetical protein